LRYPLHIAEKDYFLALVMQIINASSIGKTLIFKGVIHLECSLHILRPFKNQLK
jgi:hypothetical protein